MAAEGLLGRWFANLHSGYVHERRTNVLADALAALVAPSSAVVDVGAGDGLLAHKLLERRPDLTIDAFDVVARPDPHLPVRLFDGHQIPYPDDGVDTVLLIDVLHHAETPLELLAEACRVCRESVIVKDVTTRGVGAGATLHLMERFANARYGIRLPDRFWSEGEWLRAFARLGLTPDRMSTRLGLYPFPASLLFERRFHFLVRLRTSTP